MEKKKVRILVACHKPDKVYGDDVYIPIHVGRACSRFKEEMSEMIGDDTGDNISELNPFYCELTAQYWAWKNLDSEYIGLCHYRRYFRTRITDENVESVLDGADVLLTSPVYLDSNVLNWLTTALVPEDIFIFYEYMRRRFPDEIQQLDDYYLRRNYVNPCNMFVCKKSLFDKYAEWEFSILSDLQQIISFSDYSHQKRVLGYIAESLLPYYCELHSFGVKTEPMVPMVGMDCILFPEANIVRKIANKRFSMRSAKLKYELPNDINVSFKNDGIFAKIDETLKSR